MIPGPHIAVVLRHVALCAGRDKVAPNGHPALRLWRHVVERYLLGLAPAVGAGTIPGVDDLAPEAVFCDTFRDKLRFFNPIGHVLLGEDRE